MAGKWRCAVADGPKRINGAEPTAVWSTVTRRSDCVLIKTASVLLNNVVRLISRVLGNKDARLQMRQPWMMAQASGPRVALAPVHAIGLVARAAAEAHRPEHARCMEIGERMAEGDG